MFNGCSHLTNITTQGNLLISAARNINNMFDNCSALTSIDLKGSTFANVTDASWMFNDCSALTEIKVNTDVRGLPSSAVSTAMFNGCFVLVGGALGGKQQQLLVRRQSQGLASLCLILGMMDAGVYRVRYVGDLLSLQQRAALGFAFQPAATGHVEHVFILEQMLLPTPYTSRQVILSAMTGQQAAVVAGGLIALALQRHMTEV